jgi:hypothetical protein
MEYASNVAISEVDASSGAGDAAAVFGLGGSDRLIDGPSGELEAGYDFLQSLYADLDDFNTQSHAFGLVGSRELGPLDSGLSYRFSFATIDREKLLNMHELRPTLGFAPRPSWYLNLAYRYQRKDFAESARDADQSALALDNFVVLSDDGGLLSLGYRLENEDADGPEFDYLGHVVQLGFEMPLRFLASRPELEVGYEYLQRDYEHLTPSILRKREDRRHSFEIEITRQVTRVLELGFGYRHVTSDSNLPSADYSDDSVRLSVGFDL